MKRAKSLALWLMLASATILPVSAQQFNAAEPQLLQQQPQQQDAAFNQRLADIDAMITQRMATYNIPGYTIAIIKNGQVVFQKMLRLCRLRAAHPGNRQYCIWSG
ncbi:MAG: hypothetical protein IPI39_18860 [Candidatus Obscuribacter sp.]|nr:hypothetical protein [Candidatus Obscuribacter sp.]